MVNDLVCKRRMCPAYQFEISKAVVTCGKTEVKEAAEGAPSIMQISLLIYVYEEITSTKTTDNIFRKEF